MSRGTDVRSHCPDAETHAPAMPARSADAPERGAAAAPEPPGAARPGAVGNGCVVVTDAGHLPMLDGVEVVGALDYLEGRCGNLPPGTVVVNLCRDYGHRSAGYYVSLLAEARQQRVVPDVEALQQLRSPMATLRRLQEAGIDVSDAREPRRRAFAHAAAGDPEAAERGCAEIWSVFGTTRDARFRDLCAAVHRACPAPLLRLRLVADEEGWMVAQVACGSLADIDTPEAELLVAALAQSRPPLPRRPAPRRAPAFRIACLWDPADAYAPSDAETLHVFAHAAARRGAVFEHLGPEDLGRLARYDALFIRTVTAVDHVSYTFAQAAECLGIPVIDAPRCILRCSNKAYMQERFDRGGVPTPRTRTISRATPFEAVRDLGFPLILKQPDGTFSQAVEKAGDRAEFEVLSRQLFQRSPLLIAQEFVPTDFDWRIGILEDRVLFACRYHMAAGHWQIVKHAQNGERDYGDVEAVATASVPRRVLEAALAAAGLVGGGLYGVDVKDTPRGPLVIEVNDNPNIQTGFEDAVAGHDIYDRILGTLEARARNRFTARP